MDIEQLDLEERRSPDAPGARVRVAPLIWVVLALLALAAGFLVLGRGGTPEPDRSSAPAPPAPSARPVPSPGPDQRQYLGVSRICAPVTDGRRELRVSFRVSNVSPSPVVVQSVTGVLPQGGLRQRGPATRGGSCERAGTLELAGPIAAGRSHFFTLVFDLPKTCPARYPVQVQVGFAAGGFAETSLSILYSDLSVPDFDTCGPGRTRSGTPG